MIFPPQNVHLYRCYVSFMECNLNHPKDNTKHTRCFLGKASCFFSVGNFQQKSQPLDLAAKFLKRMIQGLKQKTCHNVRGTPEPKHTHETVPFSKRNFMNGCVLKFLSKPFWEEKKKCHASNVFVHIFLVRFRVIFERDIHQTFRWDPDHFQLIHWMYHSRRCT